MRMTVRMMVVGTRWQFSWYRTTILPLCQRAASENPLRHSASPLCSKMVHLFAPWCTALLRMVRYGWYLPEHEHIALLCSATLHHLVLRWNGSSYKKEIIAQVQSLVRFGAEPSSLGSVDHLVPFRVAVCYCRPQCKDDAFRDAVQMKTICQACKPSSTFPCFNLLCFWKGRDCSSSDEGLQE